MHAAVFTEILHAKIQPITIRQWAIKSVFSLKKFSVCIAIAEQFQLKFYYEVLMSFIGNTTIMTIHCQSFVFYDFLVVVVFTNIFDGVLFN